MLYLQSSATLSECGVYRYDLRRVWDESRPACVFVMLNPSTADADQDDATIRRCVGFADAWGCGSLTVVNLFALRSTEPRALYAHPDPVGPDNDRVIRDRVGGSGIAIAAWGIHGEFQNRGLAVLAMIESTGRELHCLGQTQKWHPKHPLYLKSDARPAAFEQKPEPKTVRLQLKRSASHVAEEAAPN
jgi:hypothetical protein